MICLGNSFGKGDTAQRNDEDNGIIMVDALDGLVYSFYGNFHRSNDCFNNYTEICWEPTHFIIRRFLDCVDLSSNLLHVSYNFLLHDK